MRIQESAEDYLETILILHDRGARCRSIDIAREMELSKPSVSRAMGLLREHEYIRVEEHGQICLTDKGREIAERIYERHRLLAKFLITLGVDEQTAVTDACRMEHVISEESFSHIKSYAQALLDQKQKITRKAYIDYRFCGANVDHCKPMQNCPQEAILRVPDENSGFGCRFVVDEEKCNGCGACIDQCCGDCMELREVGPQ